MSTIKAAWWQIKYWFHRLVLCPLGFHVISSFPLHGFERRMCVYCGKGRIFRGK
jgi:hypothetical protein